MYIYIYIFFVFVEHVVQIFHNSACNQAVVLNAIIHRGVFICVEQPAQSWGLKQEYFRELMRIGNMCLDKVSAFLYIVSQNMFCFFCLCPILCCCGMSRNAP